MAKIIIRPATEEERQRAREREAIMELVREEAKRRGIGEKKIKYETPALELYDSERGKNRAGRVDGFDTVD